jgi:hypothetical protein
LLDALALRFTEGYSAAAPALTRALELFLTLDVSSDEARHWLWLAGRRTGQVIAMELRDFESWHALAAPSSCPRRAVCRLARPTGAP